MNEKARIAADCAVTLERLNDGTLTPDDWHVMQATQWELVILAARLNGTGTETILEELNT